MQAFALDRGEATDSHGSDERDGAPAGSELGGDSRGYLNRASDAAILGVVFVYARLHDGVGIRVSPRSKLLSVLLASASTQVS